MFLGGSTDVTGLSTKGLFLACLRCLLSEGGVIFLKDLLPLRCFVLAVLKVSSQELSNSSCLVLSLSSELKY